MRILVTGSAGFIGAKLTESLLELKHEVIGIDNFLEESYSSKIKLKRQLKLRELGFQNFHQLDLRIDRIDEILDGVDVVFNMAAMPGLMKSWNDFKLYIDCNVHIVDRILNSPKYKAQLFVQASTSSVYGKIANVDEKGATNPYSPYGVSKLAAENLIKAHQENFGKDFLILRYFSVYGPGQRPDMGYSRFIDCLVNSKPIQVFGDGRAVRSNTYIDDCIEATLNTLNLKNRNETINVCGSESITVLEAIKILAQELGKTPSIIFENSRPGDQLLTQGVNLKAKELLNFQQKTTIREGLIAQAQFTLKSISS
jgi:UDP-glucuronate 4-epimerase